MMIYRVATIKDSQEYLFNEDYYFLFKVLSEVEEKTVKDWKGKTEDSLLITDWVLK